MRGGTFSSSRTSISSTRAWPAEQLAVVLDVVLVGRPQAADRDHRDPHGRCDTTRVPEDGERHFNIHTDPDTMAGHYANFANVSHSDYEFTITFARVDHEVEEGEVPGRRRVAHQPRRRASCAS